MAAGLVLLLKNEGQEERGKEMVGGVGVGAVVNN